MVSFIELCARMNNSCFRAAINCAYLEGGIKRKKRANYYRHTDRIYCENYKNINYFGIRKFTNITVSQLEVTEVGI